MQPPSAVGVVGVGDFIDLALKEWHGGGALRAADGSQMTQISQMR
jgi:hypothetical protein